MKILVTGATGFIGSHLTESLIRKGHKVKCLVRKTADLKWIKNLPVEFVVGDLFDEKALRLAVKDVEYIYHVAGVTTSKTKNGYYLGNQFATRNLLSAVKAVSRLKRFVFVSSLTAVGPSLDGIPVNEETPYHPITTYGTSKMKAELEVIRYKNKIPYTIVRPPALYGPRDTASFSFFKSVNNGIIPLVGFKQKYVNILHSKDTVEGIILAGEKPVALNNIYFIGSEKSYTWEEISDVALKTLNRKAIKIRVPETVTRLFAGAAGIVSLFKGKPDILNWEKGRDMVADAWTCDISKAKRDLGFRQNVSLEDGIKQTIEWYKEYGWLK